LVEIEEKETENEGGPLRWGTRQKENERGPGRKISASHEGENYGYCTIKLKKSGQRYCIIKRECNALELTTTATKTISLS
jgi:hypothetical protein